MGTDTDQDDARVRALADQLGYYTEADICRLFQITEGTASAWRKRGIGPAHIVIGNRTLYSHAAVRAELEIRERNRRSKKRAVIAKDLL